MYQRCYTTKVSLCIRVWVCVRVHACCHPAVRATELLVLMCYCAAWWLIMTFNVYEHWSATAPKWEPFHILTGHCLTVYWWMHNNLQYNWDLHTLHINTCTHKHIFTHRHRLTDTHCHNPAPRLWQIWKRTQWLMKNLRYLLEWSK